MANGEEDPAVDPISLMALEKYEPLQACTILALVIDVEERGLEREVLYSIFDIQIC